MRSIPSGVLDLLDAHQILLSAAHRIETDDPMAPMLVWSGVGDLTIDSEVYTGIGAPNLITPFTYEVSQAANGIDVTVASIGNALVPTVLTQDLRGRRCKVWRLFFNKAGTVLEHAEPMFYGTLDSVATSDVIGGPASVTFKLESEAQGSLRFGGAIASDQDQRIVSSTDGAFKYVSMAGEIMLYWGGDPPRRAATAFT